jgi:mRNA-degrading endonuclease YafQ of YafQ-DinJ toxin-antitoxin module
MTIKYTNQFEQKLKRRLQKNPQLRDKVKKQIRLLERDMRHPGLKVHKLKGKRGEEFAYWVEGNVRITFLLTNDYYLFTDVITHDEY